MKLFYPLKVRQYTASEIEEQFNSTRKEYNMLRIIPVEEAKKFPIGAEILLSTQGDMMWATVTAMDSYRLACRPGLAHDQSDPFDGWVKIFDWNQYGSEYWNIQLRTR